MNELSIETILLQDDGAAVVYVFRYSAALGPGRAGYRYIAYSRTEGGDGACWAPTHRSRIHETAAAAERDAVENLPRATAPAGAR